MAWQSINIWALCQGSGQFAPGEISSRTNMARVRKHRRVDLEESLKEDGREELEDVLESELREAH